MAVKVLSVMKLKEEHLEALRSVSPELRVEQVSCDTPEQMKPLLGDVEVLLTWDFPFDPAEVAPRLRWIQFFSAGIDHVLDSPVMKSDVIITTASGIHAVNMGEYALGFMLALVKRFPKAWDYKRRKEWPEHRVRELRSDELRGKTVGIIGYGSIGREVARLARAFGMRVLAMKRDVTRREDRGYRIPGTGDPDGSIPEELYPPEKLREMLAQCDFVVVAAPLTPETRHLIGRGELAAMKPTAYLINIARGGLVDEAALVEALNEGRIAGAALDTFEREPLPPESPLWDMPNVIITPHVAGATARYFDRITELFAENLRRYLRGQRLLNVVDKKLGY